MATVSETLSSGSQELCSAPYPNHLTRYSCTMGCLPRFLSRRLMICSTANSSKPSTSTGSGGGLRTAPQHEGF